MILCCLSPFLVFVGITLARKGLTGTETMESYQACLQRLLKKTTEVQNEADGQTRCFDGMKNDEFSEMRLKAICKGLGFIYSVSKDEKAFNTFGDDIIQCFYDLSKVIASNSV